MPGIVNRTYQLPTIMAGETLAYVEIDFTMPEIMSGVDVDQVDPSEVAAPSIETEPA